MSGLRSPSKRVLNRSRKRVTQLGKLLDAEQVSELPNIHSEAVIRARRKAAKSRGRASTILTEEYAGLAGVPRETPAPPEVPRAELPRFSRQDFEQYWFNRRRL